MRVRQTHAAPSHPYPRCTIGMHLYGTCTALVVRVRMESDWDVERSNLPLNLPCKASKTAHLPLIMQRKNVVDGPCLCLATVGMGGARMVSLELILPAPPRKDFI